MKRVHVLGQAQSSAPQEANGRKTLLIVGLVFSLAPVGMVTPSRAADEDKAKTPEQTATILDKIPVQSGDLFDPRNQPRASLRSAPAADLPTTFESEIRDFINWPKDYQPPTACPYTDDDKHRIVAEGMFYTKVPSSMGEGGGFRSIGKFLVDKCLNPLLGIWDGKKEGAIHTIIGNVTIFDYQFQSDETNPLVFRLTKSGYAYVEGKGVVIDLKTRKRYAFPA